MRIAIVDDSVQDRHELHQLLSQQLEARRLRGELFEYGDGAAFWAAFAPGRFDLLFLDIYLPLENGLELARTVRAADPSCRLIFFTRSYDHAVDSYQVRAAYYLTKPLDRSRLEDALSVCLAGISRDSRYLDVRVKGEPLRLAFSDIYHVDCENRTVWLHLKDKNFAVSDTLASVSEALLADPRFLLCNRGLLVNMDHIRQTKEGEFVLKNGVRVPLGVRGRGELKKSYLSYSLRALQKGESV